MREWDRQRFALSITAKFLSNFVYAKSVSTIALSLVPVHAYRHDIYFIGVVHETQAISMLQLDVILRRPSDRSGIRMESKLECV